MASLVESSSSSTHGEKRPPDSAFRQQTLRAWQPILTPRPVIVAFLVVGIAFIPIGAGIVYSSNKVIEVGIRYDHTCMVGTVCDVILEVKETMEPPSCILNTQTPRYVKSRSDKQLRGEILTAYSDLADCDPYISVNDSRDSKLFYNPCGLIAHSIFNDTFIMFDPEMKRVVLRKEGIAWASDKAAKFNNPPANAPGIRLVADFEDEDFIVWMRTAALPNFRKLYRIIDQRLTPGNYTLQIKSHYPVAKFAGQKHVVLSTTTWIGGRNPFLGYAYIALGGLCFLFGLVFFIRHLICPREMGDTAYLAWNRSASYGSIPQDSPVKPLVLEH